MLKSIRTWFAKQRLIGRLNAIKRGVDIQIEYDEYFADDYRVVPEGVRAKGNCAVYAATYADRARKQGFKVFVYDGIHRRFGPHAMCIVATQFGNYQMDYFGRVAWPFNPDDWKRLALVQEGVNA